MQRFTLLGKLCWQSARILLALSQVMAELGPVLQLHLPDDLLAQMRVLKFAALDFASIDLSCLGTCGPWPTLQTSRRPIALAPYCNDDVLCCAM